MDEQERDLLAETMAMAIDGSFKEQTRHIVEAMPCGCVMEESYRNDGECKWLGGTKVFEKKMCNRCVKLKELKE